MCTPLYDLHKKDTRVANNENASITIFSNLLQQLSSLNCNKEEMMLQLIPVVFGVELNKLTKAEQTTLKILIQKGPKKMNIYNQ